MMVHFGLRRALAPCAALALLLTLPAPGAYAQTSKPLKLGALMPLSGPFASLGQYAREGLTLYLQEHHDELGGRKVEVVYGDDTNVPQVGLTQLRRLVEQEHVDLIFGPVAANVGAAVVPYVEQQKLPMIWPIVSDDDLTQRTPSAYVARTGWSSSQTTHVLGDYAYKTLKYRRVATIAYDFNFGWQSIGGFVAAFQADGGKIVKQVWTPNVTTDFSPYLSALPRDADAVMCSFSGQTAINFMHQYREFGLKLPVICQGNATDESFLDQEGPQAVGIISALHYSAALDTPANRAFVARYTKAYGHGPSYYGEGAYDAAEILDHALAATHGTVGDPTAFVKTLRAVRISDAARGPIAIDAYGNPVEDVYIRRVDERNGKLQNTVIKTYPNVSQFWTFDPKAFLAHPVYSRTYPPCNACSG
ncbi:MAG TPA: ABC transporter substrate-binding protein [Candidatus Limnocylindria bacterium]|nr:ABC transporter substrate-binding protein [Candidatus Limnocylindria bacterium]